MFVPPIDLFLCLLFISQRLAPSLFFYPSVSLIDGRAVKSGLFENTLPLLLKTSSQHACSWTRIKHVAVEFLIWTNSPTDAHGEVVVGRGLCGDLWLASVGSGSDPSWLEMEIIEMNGSAPDSLIISAPGFMPDPSSSITPALPHHQRLHRPWWIIISGGISNCSSQRLLKIVDEGKFSWGHIDIKLFFGAYVFIILLINMHALLDLDW